MRVSRLRVRGAAAAHLGREKEEKGTDMSYFYEHTYQARSSSKMQPRTDSSPQRKCVRKK